MKAGPHGTISGNIINLLLKTFFLYVDRTRSDSDGILIIFCVHIYIGRDLSSKKIKTTFQSMLLDQDSGLSSTSAISGGSGGTRDATPLSVSFFFSFSWNWKKLCQIIGSRLSLWGCCLRETWIRHCCF